MSKPDLMPLAEEERADLLALLRELTPAQWDAQSLCTHWRVRDVATHIVSYDELSKPRQSRPFFAGGSAPARSTTSPWPATETSTPTASSTWWPATSTREVCRRDSGRDCSDRRHHPPSRHQASPLPAANHPCTPARPCPHLLAGSPHLALQRQREGTETRRHRRRLDRRRRTGGHRSRRGTPHGCRGSRARRWRTSAETASDLAETGTPALTRLCPKPSVNRSESVRIVGAGGAQLVDRRKRTGLRTAVHERPASHTSRSTPAQ